MATEDSAGNGEIERVTMEDEVRAERVLVPMEEVVREQSPEPLRELPPLTRIGYNLAIFLLLYLGTVTAFLLVDYFVNVPSLPSGTAFDETSLAQYEKLSQISLDRTMKLLDALVLKGFLPVLTAVLGYIFGTRGAERSES